MLHRFITGLCDDTGNETCRDLFLRRATSNPFLCPVLGSWNLSLFRDLDPSPYLVPYPFPWSPVLCLDLVLFPDLSHGPWSLWVVLGVEYS